MYVASYLAMDLRRLKGTFFLPSSLQYNLEIKTNVPQSATYSLSELYTQNIEIYKIFYATTDYNS